MSLTGLVYTIILNWNGWQDTIECVDSCRKLTYSNFKIIIIDNDSTDGSEVILRERFPDIELIQAGSNLGFSGGNNIGIRYALERGAEYIWLLNNDTVVARESLSELVKVVVSDDRIGIVGSKLYYRTEPNTIAFAGGFWKDKPLDPSERGVNEIDSGQYDSVDDVDFITGCSMLIRTTILKDIGEMPTDFFLYWEDIDWNASASESGWRIVFVYASCVWHKVSASTNNQQGMKTYYNVRNRLLFLKRHRRNLLFIAILRTVVVCLKYLLSGQKKTALLYFNGLKDFAIGRFGRMS
ncbi:MAG: glycosyltransferase family 2 protein [Desulfuromonadales bacterium]